MKLVELTQEALKPPLILNIDCIESMVPCSGYTRIRTTSGADWTVIERMEEILAVMDEKVRSLV